MFDQLTYRLLSQRTFEAAADTLLNDVIALHGAEFGDLQLAVDDELVLVGQRGLPASFLRTFRRVKKEDGCACGRALRLGKTVVVADVETDPEYAAFRTDAESAGYRSVQSTPLVTRSGSVLGMVSTMFANVHEPTPIELEMLGRYCQSAAEYLTTLLGNENLPAKAEQMSRALYDDMLV
jgi:GAF domain-containing protein